MKRPIDPNLNDNFCLDGFDDMEKNEKISAAPSTEEENPDMVLRVKRYYSKDEAPPTAPKSSENRGGSENGGGSENSGGSSSNSEQSHSSGNAHHSSSGSHNHSDGSHHHSSGNHHHSSHHHSSGSHHHTKKKKKKISTAAKIAIIFLLLIFIIVAGIIGTFIYLEHKGKNELTPNIEQVEVQEDFEETIEYNGHTYKFNRNVVSIAFIGVDKNELGTETIAGSAGQADADIVFTVDTNTGRVKVIAIPRDTMVDVDLYSESGIDLLRQEEMQLCLSYAYGNNPDASAQNVVKSMERILYNIPIEKYFVLDLDGIAPINDAIGGVTVESLCDFDDYGISKGDTVTLKGDMAEVYVRQRDMDDIEASLNRTQRQVQYIKAFAAQLIPAVTSDFGTVKRLYNQATQYSATNMDLSNVTYLASLLLSKGITDFETTTLQGEMTSAAQPTGQVYAEFYLDEKSTLETVLDVFYTQID